MSLGVWQLHRLAWKEGLIAEIEIRANAAPQPFPPITEWPKLRAEDYEYRHVAVTGTFEHGEETLVFRASGGPAGKQPGYHVLTLLRLKTRGIVMVNRGFVPLDRKEQSSRLAGLIEGETTVTGLMRQPEARNFFTPADDPAAGLYFTRDPDLIARHFGLANAAPLSRRHTRSGWLAKRRCDGAQPFQQPFLLCLDLVRPGFGSDRCLCRFRLAKALKSELALKSARRFRFPFRRIMLDRQNHPRASETQV